METFHMRGYQFKNIRNSFVLNFIQEKKNKLYLQVTGILQTSRFYYRIFFGINEKTIVNK